MADLEFSKDERKEEPEETADVFEIISDLEQQLDSAFNIRDAQNEEISSLNEKLAKQTEALNALEAKVKRLESALKDAVESKEGLGSELELLENDRFESGERIKSLEEKLAGLEERLAVSEEERGSAVSERDNYKQELDKAKESLDEIRLALATTRAKAREHSYDSNSLQE